ncbi:sedoheptulokinase isoform X2 [Vulpes vulpes]|uniref:Sedoheptulokinase isoform X2 n=1 Tax=Vulpes vulpes TaxID=9627 RepID=A0ABM4ZNF5_VULVU
MNALLPFLGSCSRKSVALECQDKCMESCFGKQTKKKRKKRKEKKKEKKRQKERKSYIVKCEKSPLYEERIEQKICRRVYSLSERLLDVLDHGQSLEGCEWREGRVSPVFEPGAVSHLVTWQDGRCSSGFLASLPQPESHLNVASGFGCATIFWLLKNSPELLKSYDAAGTIHDYVVAMLCGLPRSLMCDQNAASWGYFNTQSQSWNLEILRASGFPVHLLPDIAEAGSVAGRTSHAWFEIPKGTPVGVALGDLQASVYSCMAKRTDAVLNISTSVQLATSMPSGFQPAQTPDPAAPVTYFPYFDRTYLAVAASLNGGNVLATFVHMLVQWMMDLGLEVEESTVYSRMIQAAAQQRDTCLTITPTVLGERHLPDQLASVTRISSSDLTLGHVTRALCRGIVQNLHSMLPFHQLKEWGVERVIGSGSALSRNEVLKQEVQRAFPFPVSFGQDVDAAVGAALVMLQKNLNQRES